MTTLLVSAWIFHFIYPLCYTIAVHNIKYSQKHIIRTGRAREGYSTITVSIGDFEKAYNKEDEELYMDGKMYEAIDFHKQGDTMYCTVLYDNEETKLQHGYSIEQKHANDKTTSIPLSFWCTVHYIPGSYTHPALFINILNQPLFKAYHASLSAGYAAPVTMPPEPVFV